MNSYYHLLPILYDTKTHAVNIEYESYISSHDHKRADDKKLANLAKKIKE